MNRIAILIPIALVAFGCNDRDATDVKLNAAVALASAREAVATAWNSAMTEAGKVTSNSSKAALEQAKEQTARLQSELSKIEIRNPIDQAQMDAAQQQMEKIQAALTVKNLREQSENAVQNAIATGKIAQQKYEDASRQLAELDANYRDLKERLDSAQATYDRAASMFQGALDKVRELSGSK